MDKRIKNQMNVLDIIKMNIKSYRFVTCIMKPNDNILFFNCQENLNIDLALAKELVTNRLSFTNNEKHYLIQQISNIFDIDYEAIQYLKDTEQGLKNILGAAYITSGPISKQLAEVFIKQKKKFPAKMFDSEREAVTWINELKEFHTVTKQ